MSKVVHTEVEDFGTNFITKGFTGRYHVKVVIDDGREGYATDDKKSTAIANAIKDALSK